MDNIFSKLVILTACTLLITSCATKKPTDPNEVKASLVTFELNHAPVSRESVIRQLTWRAKNCWIGKIQGFEDYTVSEPEQVQFTGDIKETWQIVLTHPTLTPYTIQSMTIDRQGKKAFAVRTVYKQHHQNIHQVVKKSAREIEKGGLGC